MLPQPSFLFASLRKPQRQWQHGWRSLRSSTLSRNRPQLTQDPAEDEVGIFADPFGIAVGPDGSIYIADAGEKNSIKKFTNKGELTTLAGGGVATIPTRTQIVSGNSKKRGWAEGYQDRAGENALFNTPSGLALDRNGNIYVADTGNNRIRKITPQGMVSTVAGNGRAGYADGPTAQAQFDGPIGLAVDVRGNIYVADTYNNRLRKITPDGQVSTLAGAGHTG